MAIGIPLFASVPVDDNLPDWYKVGYRPKKPMKALADSNLLKSPHSPNIAVTVFLTFSKKSKNQILHSTNPFVKGF